MASDQKMKRSRSKVAISTSVDVATRGQSAGDNVGRSLSRMKFRRQSFGFSRVPGIGGVTRRRSSQLGIEFKRPPLMYLNTYQLEPRIRFHVPNVTKAVDVILDAFYNETQYSITDTPGKTMLIADEVMRTVKAMNFDRYRILSVVTMAQKRAQSYNNAVGFLWDHEYDCIVDAHRENNTSFIQVTVFGVYLD